MSEIWATIAEFPNYEISSQGRVRHKKTGRVRKPSINRGGYITHGFSKDGVSKHRTPHRMMHIAFLGPVDGLEVNHKDGDKLQSHNERAAASRSGEGE